VPSDQYLQPFATAVNSSTSCLHSVERIAVSLIRWCCLVAARPHPLHVRALATCDDDPSCSVMANLLNDECVSQARRDVVTDLR